MKVVFLEDVPNVGRAGDIKEVSDGYGRNYLLPRKLAIINAPGAAARVKTQMEARAETEKLKKLATRIEGQEISLKVKMGAKDRMHGSITAANVATELEKAIGESIDKRKVVLEEPIKQLGTYEIPVKLGKDLEPKIKVNVVDKDKEPVPAVEAATSAETAASKPAEAPPTEEKTE